MMFIEPDNTAKNKRITVNYNSMFSIYNIEKTHFLNHVKDLFIYLVIILRNKGK